MSSILMPILALPISFFIVVSFFSKAKVKNRDTKLFGYLIVVNLAQCILDTLTIIYAKTIANNQVVGLFQKIDYILMITWVSILFAYTVGINNQDEKKLNRIKYCVCIFNIITAFIIFLLPIEVINYSNVLDAKGIASVANLIVIGIYFTLMIYESLKGIIANRNKLRKYSPFIVLIITGILGIIIRNYFPNLIFIPYLFCYSNLVMYFTIENPDVKAIAAIELAKDQAEKANAAKTDFLSSMSHEIRTPLNAIVGFSEAIQEEKTLEAAKEDAKDIILASQNLLELVNGILDISKLEANKMEIVNNEYNLREECQNLMKLIKPRIGEKPINLNLVIAPDVPEILYGDKSKVKEIMSNLLTNAVKYTKKGSISVNINCINKNDECSLMVSVEDTGRGIKPEQIDKLFNKFERLEEDRNTTIEGAGLGLAITKRLVELMDGKIVVQSVYGSGSKFTFYLKQRISKSKPSHNTHTNNSKLELYDKKVLIVDDNDLNIKIAERMLNNYGITVTTCQSGLECVDLIKNNNHYDLILMDDMMPKMSGTETLHILREIPEFKDRVVVLTANAIEGMKERYLSEGFEDYLSKPIDKKELERVLRRFLNNEIEHANFEPLPEEMFEIADSIVEKLNKEENQ